MTEPDPAITIRPIRTTDIAAIRALRIEALRRHPVAFTADLAEAEARSDDDWARWMERSLGDAGVLMVAEARDGSLVGMTGIDRQRGSKVCHIGVIWGVYVRPDSRGHGLGRALLHACLDWARDRGITIARLGVTVGNTPAIACYERAGFTAYGTEPDAVHHQGRYYDEILMYRRIG